MKKILLLFILTINGSISYSQNDFGDLLFGLSNEKCLKEMARQFGQSSNVNSQFVDSFELSDVVPMYLGAESPMLETYSLSYHGFRIQVDTLSTSPDSIILDLEQGTSPGTEEPPIYKDLVTIAESQYYTNPRHAHSAYNEILSSIINSGIKYQKAESSNYTEADLRQIWTSIPKDQMLHSGFEFIVDEKKREEIVVSIYTHPKNEKDGSIETVYELSIWYFYLAKDCEKNKKNVR